MLEIVLLSVVVILNNSLLKNLQLEQKKGETRKACYLTILKISRYSLKKLFFKFNDAEGTRLLQ